MNLKLKVFNVGNADSILIEWESEIKFKKIGIIDCSKNNNNPTVQYLIENNVKEIEFVILTHPHYDRYSGLLQLFFVCNKRNIKINNFFHSSAFRIATNDKVDFASLLTSSENSIGRKNSLLRIYNFLHHQTQIKDSFIKNINIITEGFKLLLNKSISLKVFSPSTYEIEKYYNQFIDITKSKNLSGNANLLSTILQISDAQNQILLTSDATRYSLQRLLKEDELFSKEVLVAQVPNNGSLKCHETEFWNKLNIRNCIAFVSVGPNSYSHPNKEVIAFFEFNAKKVISTGNSINSKSELIPGGDNFIIHSPPEGLNEVRSISLLLNEDRKGNTSINSSIELR